MSGFLFRLKNYSNNRKKNKGTAEKLRQRKIYLSKGYDGRQWNKISKSSQNEKNAKVSQNLSVTRDNCLKFLTADDQRLAGRKTVTFVTLHKWSWSAWNNSAMN